MCVYRMQVRAWYLSLELQVRAGMCMQEGLVPVPGTASWHYSFSDLILLGLSRS